MRVSGCLYPKEIVNPYTQRAIVVPCGCCESCLDSRAALWVQRLDEEIKYSRYTLFVTLQYDEQHIPQVVRLRKEDTIKEDICYIDSETGEIFSFYDPSIRRHHKADYEFVRTTKVLPVLSKRDIQLMIKNLRDKFKKLDNAKLRYWVTGEIGPRTFRPHYHLLLFFESTLCIQNIESLLAKVWRYGTIFDPHLVSGSASEYVASYVNCFSRLPSIYTHRKLRPFSLFSKRPPIGVRTNDIQDFKQIVLDSAISQTIFRKSDSTFVDVPLWRTLQDRLFPAIPRFASVSNSLRRKLYGFGNIEIKESIGAAECVERFYSTNRKQGQPSLIPGYDYLNRYFDIISRKQEKRIELTGSLRYVYRDVYHFESLVRFMRIVKRVCRNAAELGISVDDYVTCIEKFYKIKEKERLKEYYRFQDEYFRLHPQEVFKPYFDVGLCQRCDGKFPSEITKSDYECLEYLGFCFEQNKPISLSLDGCFDYLALRATHEKIYHDNTKVKGMNDYYLQRNAEKFGNVILFKQLIDLDL